jgi:solute:Na+ symporter, SSS family
MSYLNTFDYAVIGIYFSILIALGIFLKSRASASIEDYFIGDRKLPWWALGISGMSSFLDVAGTTVIVSFLFMLGPQGLFIEFRGGVCLILAVMLLWTGKWHRRSQCITGAEWMIYRFGDGFGGRFAQSVAVAGTFFSTIGMLSYLVIGVGNFLSLFLPFPPLTCALILIGVATVYTMVSGFYGVVFTDLFQALIILGMVIGITIFATLKLSANPDFAAIAESVTGNPNWVDSVPKWRTAMPTGYKQYEHLILFTFFYLMKNIFQGMGSGAEPKYFGARNDRECGTLTFLWTWMMMLRWPLMIGFAILGIFLVDSLFPDFESLSESAALIKEYMPDLRPEHWGRHISGLVNSSDRYPTQLVEGLQSILGPEWNSKLHLLSFEGTVNPEKILPAVVLFYVRRGLRGLILVALIAASMSTFDTHVNMATGFLTRDVYQKYIRPQAKTRELIYASWVFVVLFVGLGFLFATLFRNINDIWGWITMGLGAGLLVPTVLRFYWWRFNGGGFAAGTVAGLAAAFVQRLTFPDLSEVWNFIFIASIGLLGSVAGTYLTRPTDPDVLENFYRTTRPFGIWGHMKRQLSEEERRLYTREHRNDILALPFVLLWQTTLFILPMQFILRTWGRLSVTLILFFVGLAGMYVFWYRNLPPANQETNYNKTSAKP